MHHLTIWCAKYAIIIPVIAYCVIFIRQRYRYKELVLTTLLSAIVALALVKLAATLHNDPRPFIRDGVKPYFVSSTDNGFPSDHTVLSGLIACIIFQFNKAAGTILLGIAILIGAARVISGVHHTQDIVGGLLIALLSVLAASIVTRWALHKPQDAA